MSYSLRYVEYPASPDREFACEYCSLSFDRHHDLKRHIETHSGEKPYLCDRGCGKAFTRKDALKRHQTSFPFCPPVRGSPQTAPVMAYYPSSRMPSAPPPPTNGGAPSPAQYNLGGYSSAQPYASPAGIPPQASSPYGSRSSWAPSYGPVSPPTAYYDGTGSSSPNYGLDAPMSSHHASSFIPAPLYAGDYPATPTRPYICDTCPLSFDRHHDLKRHKVTHAGERPYLCNGGCEKTFTRKDALKRHQLSKECGNV